MLCVDVGLAQPTPQTAGSQESSAATAEGDSAGNVTPEYVRQQMVDLSHPNYRTRQLARWRLENSPTATLKELEAALPSLDQNSAAQLIDIASSLAIHENSSVSIEAHALLVRLARSATSIGNLANNTLNAIADLQESQAIETLVYWGAYVGPINFSYNGRAGDSGNALALQIDESFRGTTETVKRIRFLRSIEAISLSGPAIDANYFQAIAELKQLKVLKLRKVKLSIDDLKLLTNHFLLEHLGLNYMDVDDSFVPQLLELPINQSLRLYGTKITEAGERQLINQLDGIEIYRGNGGFLGVGTNTASTIVTSVTSGSAAEIAGIRQYDRLTHINDVPINNFADLRRELGKSEAGEKVIVRLERGTIDMTLSVVLLEEPSSPRT